MKNVFILVSLILLIVLAGRETNKYDTFAKCLTEKGVMMYGAYWCPHSKKQKAMFSNSWEHINYVECSQADRKDQTLACKLEGISGYPTWEFENGKRISGELTLKELSSLSKCELVIDK